MEKRKSIIEMVQNGDYHLINGIGKKYIKEALKKTPVNYVINAVNKTQTDISQSKETLISSIITGGLVAAGEIAVRYEYGGEISKDGSVLLTIMYLGLAVMAVFETICLMGETKFKKVAMEVTGYNPDEKHNGLYISKISTLPNVMGKRPKVKTLIQQKI